MVMHQESLRTPLEYPSPPFSGGFCKRVELLPSGIRKICLQSSFSYQVIDCLERAVQAFNPFNTADTTIEVLTLLADAYALTDMPNLTTVERVMLTSLSYLCLHCDLVQCGHHNTSNLAAVEGQGRKLSSISDLSDCDTDCLVWAALMLRETASKTSASNTFFTKVLSTERISPGRQAQLEEAFIRMPSRYEWLRPAGPLRGGAS